MIMTGDDIRRICAVIDLQVLHVGDEAIYISEADTTVSVVRELDTLCADCLIYHWGFEHPIRVELSIADDIDLDPDEIRQARAITEDKLGTVKPDALFMQVSAKVIADVNGDGFGVLVYVAKRWRIFGAPYAVLKDKVQLFNSALSARRGAEKVAEELGIKLKWEK
jgi:hypothetical protein